MNNYDLDSLIETFTRHSEEWDKMYQKHSQFSKEINLPLAFLTFAKEIKELKEKCDSTDH